MPKKAVAKAMPKRAVVKAMPKKAVASRMAEVSSSSYSDESSSDESSSSSDESSSSSDESSSSSDGEESCIPLSFSDHLSPHWQKRVACLLCPRHAAVTPAALRSHHAPARAHAGSGVVLLAAIARHEAASGRTAAAPRSHAHAVFAVCASARHVRLRGDRVPSTGHRACWCVRDLQDIGALGCVDNGACHAGSREESAGAVAAARVLCCALRLSCQCLRALCV
jgi:hypothetical protein